MSKMNLMIATALWLLASGAWAQDAPCTSDADCGEGMRCEMGLTLERCQTPPCETTETSGSCIDALIGTACDTDADCGGGDLVCSRQLAVADCPPDMPDCEAAQETQGSCQSNETLAFSSGIAVAESGAAPAADEGAAGGAATPEASSAGGPEAEGPGDNSASPDANSGDSGCSVGGQTGGTHGLWALALPLAVLGLRRRRAAR
ncbi:MAG: MYXO-CTERM sorting domain-containing protein [Myxococcales bacterium]|nr:MYXO-CTERM sorting domain-containing protein [Myxococcales bacterium]